MEISKGEVLRQALEKVKERTGLSDDEVKNLFIRDYILDKEKSTDEMFGELLHGKKKEEE